jgi:hypothetical protein
MKAPINTPEEGDTVKLRGRPAVGVLLQVDNRLWSWVKWNDGTPAPRICHLYELEKAA